MTSKYWRIIGRSPKHERVNSKQQSEPDWNQKHSQDEIEIAVHPYNQRDLDTVSKFMLCGKNQVYMLTDRSEIPAEPILTAFP